MEIFVLKKESNVIGVTNKIKEALLAIEEGQADEFKKFEINDNTKNLEEFIKSTIEPIERNVKSLYENCSTEIQKLKLNEEFKNYLNKLQTRSNEIKENCQDISGVALKEIGNFFIQLGERFSK